LIYSLFDKKSLKSRQTYFVGSKYFLPQLTSFFFFVNFIIRFRRHLFYQR